MLTDKTEIVETSRCNNSERILKHNVIEKFFNDYFSNHGNYTISDDGVVNVDGSVELSHKNFNEDGFTELPIQFGHIKGNFIFEHSNITTLKGFPHTVGDYCNIDYSKKLNSLEFSPKCKRLFFSQCLKLHNLDYINCNELDLDHTILKKFGTNFNVKVFCFTKFPTPTANEMRHLIGLNPNLDTLQKKPWIQLLKDYSKHKDIFRAAQEFEALYNEPWIKPENKIEIINNELDLSL